MALEQPELRVVGPLVDEGFQHRGCVRVPALLEVGLDEALAPVLVERLVDVRHHERATEGRLGLDVALTCEKRQAQITVVQLVDQAEPDRSLEGALRLCVVIDLIVLDDHLLAGCVPVGGAVGELVVDRGQLLPRAQELGVLPDREGVEAGCLPQTLVELILERQLDGCVRRRIPLVHSLEELDHPLALALLA